MHCTYHRKKPPPERSQLHFLATHEKSLKPNFDRLCSLYPLVRGTKNIWTMFPSTNNQKFRWCGVGGRRESRFRSSGMRCVHYLGFNWSKWQDAHTFLEWTFKEFTSAPTTAPLVVLAYHQTGFPDSDNDLALILPHPYRLYSKQLRPRRMLIDSAQVQVPSPHTSVICISTTHSFFRNRNTSMSILPAIADAHPRQTSNRAIIESFSSTRPNLFASPFLLRVFRPMLFRPSPPDLFSGSKELSLSTFQESSEPQWFGRLLGTLLRSCPARSPEPGTLNRLTSLNAYWMYDSCSDGYTWYRCLIKCREQSFRTIAFDLGKVDEPSVCFWK